MSETLSKAERTRQFIIEKTAPVFNAKGYTGTSMSDLTKATGLTKGSIYGNFENKDEVALAAFDFNFGKVSAYIGKKMSETENSIERLLVYPNEYRNFFKIPFMKSGCPVLNTATEADDTHPQLREKVTRALAYWKKSIENQVKRGIERKEIKSDTNAAEIATVMIAIVEGAIMQAKVSGKATELKTTMDYLEKMILNLRR